MYLKKVEGRGCYEVIHAICEVCHGKGEVEQTNEEWLRQCSTEELAEFLFQHGDCIGCPASKEICRECYNGCKTAFMEWLQEKHN